MRRGWAAALAVLALAGVVRAEDISVSVAASFTDVLEAIGRDFEQQHPNVTVAFNFGGSGLLARQIEDGAPVDVFLSAGWPEIERLAAKGLVAGEAAGVARNRLGVGVSAGPPWAGREPPGPPPAPDP